MVMISWMYTHTELTKLHTLNMHGQLYLNKALTNLYKKLIQLGSVVHACNPTYLGGGDQEAHASRSAQTKKFTRFPSQPIKARHRGTHLSSQPCRKHKTGESQSRPAGA
jgi:hypothetical protein